MYTRGIKMRRNLAIILAAVLMLFGCTTPAAQENNSTAEQNEVPQESAVQWIVEPGGPIMGTGDLKFGINFRVQQETIPQSQAVDDLSHQSITLYNFTSMDVEIVSTDHAWTYRVYRITDGQKETLYSQEIYNEDNPFYSGKLPSRNFAYNRFDVPYWTEETAQPGTYKIVLEHPDLLLYRDEDGELQRFRFAEGTAPGLCFESELTIE